MLTGFVRFLTVAFAAAFLAAQSVVSAHDMAPERASIQQMQTALALGATLEDFCGTTGPDHSDCPFCHKLPEPPVPVAPQVMRTLAFALADGRGRDLVTGPLHIRSHAAPRAPPLTV
ncbi:hypothetical protein [Loktanella sp. 3ANDIMAR09]|uniref:hypothetical protein n=1 Tax=Loktanella sp. 3ANDIMAR09 TaxID=1225657 RepID=UPI0006F351EC|nr:hypothetical protein [Loktanella sp. 3ANDIMAR09]